MRLVTTFIPSESPSNAVAAEETFHDVAELARSTPTDIELIVGGDFNASPCFPGHPPDHHVGRFQGGEPLGHSRRLLRLLVEADLCLPDTFQLQPWRRRWTWRNSETGQCHQLDHFLCRSAARPMFSRISTRTDVAQGSDHRLVDARIILQCKQKSAHMGTRERNTRFARSPIARTSSFQDRNPLTGNLARPTTRTYTKLSTTSKLPVESLLSQPPDDLQRMNHSVPISSDNRDNKRESQPPIRSDFPHPKCNVKIWSSAATLPHGG